MKNKHVLVCGLAKSGQAAIKLLLKHGAIATAQDLKSDIKLECDNIKLQLGQQPDITKQELIIISPGISIYAPFVQEAIKKNIPVWGEMELAYRYCKSPITAITGTNGKTTVTTVVGEMYKLVGESVTLGNIGVPFASIADTIEPTTNIALEVSSFQLETICKFAPKISAILNITPDHLDRHKNMETYIEMKSRIFSNQKKDDYCILNFDNIITRNTKPPCNAIFFSCKEKTDVYISDNYIIYNNQKIANINDTILMQENALAVTAIGIAAGIPFHIIKTALENHKGVEHRLEYIANFNKVDYYNDSKATNVDSAIKALVNIKKPIILIAGGSDKYADFTPWVELFNEKVIQLILIGETAEKIADTCKKTGYNNFCFADSLKDAVDKAKNIAKPGQVVLLSPACASFDMFKNFEDRGKKFKELIL